MGRAADFDPRPLTLERDPSPTLSVVSALTVSRLARQVGMTPDALRRYYERTELLPKPERTASGSRLYDDKTADRLRFIKARSALASGSGKSASFSKCSTVACVRAAIPRPC